MPTKVKSIQFLGEVENHGSAKLLLGGAGDTVLVKRGRPRLVVLSCPCGCGEEIVINLDPRSGPAWLLYQSKRGLTLYPSVWREGGCKSHFIVWNNKIYWCRYDSLFDPDYDQPMIDDEVYKVVKSRGTIHYRDIAELIGEIPWEVLSSCRRLSRIKKVCEEKDSGCFSYSPNEGK